MARKHKELPIFENVEIVDVAAEGNSIARVNDLVVFIPYGAPGDIVDIKISKKKKSRIFFDFLRRFFLYQTFSRQHSIILHYI